MEISPFITFFWGIFFKIILPNARFGILVGIILSFTRALGEFGATIMFAGNIPGKTQTMSTAIYSAVQANNYDLAFLLSGNLIIFSLIFIILPNRLNFSKKRLAILSDYFLQIKHAND